MTEISKKSYRYLFNNKSKNETTVLIRKTWDDGEYEWECTSSYYLRIFSKIFLDLFKFTCDALDFSEVHCRAWASFGFLCQNHMYILYIYIYIYNWSKRNDRNRKTNELPNWIKV